MNEELKFGDKVKVKEGFYEGKEGVCLHCVNKLYSVRLLLDYGLFMDFKDVEFLANDLEKIGG
jgi:hypothetical protein